MGSKVESRRNKEHKVFLSVFASNFAPLRETKKIMKRHQATILLHLVICMVLYFPDIVSKPVNAQQGISMQFVMPANPSPYFSDWNDGSMQVRLLVVNESENTYFVHFSFEVQQDGRPVIRTNHAIMPVEMIHPGVNVFEANDLIVYDALLPLLFLL